MITCFAEECKFNSENSCLNADIIIKPFTMPDEEGKIFAIGFVCSIGTEALYKEIPDEDTSQEESL